MARGDGGDERDTLIERGPDRVSPFSLPAIIPNMGAAWVSIQLGTRGPLSSPCTACAASQMAIGDGLDAIRLGRADVMLCGGTDEASLRSLGIPEIVLTLGSEGAVIISGEITTHVDAVPVDGPVDATVTLPGSKSITNRALVCAALADAPSTLTGVLDADDTHAMAECLLRLGASDSAAFTNR